MKTLKPILCFAAVLLCFLASAATAHASEASLAIPDLWNHGSFQNLGRVRPAWLLLCGTLVICGTLGISLYQLFQIKKQPAHQSMLAVSETIFQTCKAYLIQQGKFLLMLFGIIAIAITYYLLVTGGSALTVVLVLLFSIVGMGGSYAVAWYGIRVNTYANSRTAFASLRGKPWDVVNIPLRAGMSVGLFLISLELVMMVFILLAVPRAIVGYCFLGFAIGESLGASALRIAGGIFTKIADIGSDLMKIVFKVKEDDPRNPGVIADCTGDNAGDSVGPTADGFETYGVTGVALIVFITLAVPDVDIQARLIVWIFAMRFLMDFLSGVSYFINQWISEKMYAGKKEFDFEQPLTRLIWIAAILCISTSFLMSWLLLSDLKTVGEFDVSQLWWQLATIIGCGTLAAVLIPEFTKIFTSSHSKHVHEIVTASREGGPSLTILSGLVAGNFSAFWMGILIMSLMAGAYGVSLLGLDNVMEVRLAQPHSDKLNSLETATAEKIKQELGDIKGDETPATLEEHSATLKGLEPTTRAVIESELVVKPVGVGSIFAFGLVAFGFLCMGPVNIAVDSYGPVTDNAQSIFELAQTEQIPGVKEEIRRDFGFEPNFEEGKHYLEANDSAGNTFKATAKPVLIGTAVVGATTMIFSIILLLGKAGVLRAELDGRPRAPRLHVRRGRGLLVLGRVDAGRDDWRLPGRRVHQAKHGPHQERSGYQRFQNGRPDLHQIRPGRHVEHLHRPDDDHAGLRVLQPELLRGLPDFDRGVRPVPGDLHGQRRRRLGQRQEVGRGRSEGEGHAASRGDGHRRHGRRPVQGHDVGFAEPDHQVLDAVRPAGGRDRAWDAVQRVVTRGGRRGAGGRPVLRVAVVLRHANPAQGSQRSEAARKGRRVGSGRDALSGAKMQEPTSPKRERGVPSPVLRAGRVFSGEFSLDLSVILS